MPYPYAQKGMICIYSSKYRSCFFWGYIRKPVHVVCSSDMKQFSVTLKKLLVIFFFIDIFELECLSCAVIRLITDLI